MTDYVVIAILVVVIGAALAYIIREKKRGRCIGCPDADSCQTRSQSEGAAPACSGCCSSCRGCHTNTK